MIILAACAAGFILDLLFGDPAWIYHPIRIIGHLISGLEKKLYKEGTSPESLRRRGTLLWIGTAGIATLVPCLLLWAAFQILVLAAACHKVSEDRKHESKTGIGYRDD